MITSKSKAIETDCRSLLVYIKLLCDSTRIVWTFWRVPLQKATVCKQRKVRFAFLTNITSLSNQYLSIWPETTLNKWDHDSVFFFFFFFQVTNQTYYSHFDVLFVFFKGLCGHTFQSVKWLKCYQWCICLQVYNKTEIITAATPV